MLTLANLKLGTVAKIIKFEPQKESAIRLLELGIIEGESVQIIREAPFGDPIEIEIMNYRLCLRKKDAESIYVTL